MKTKISIAKDFSRTPGGRTYQDGSWNGMYFRDLLLEPALVKGYPIEINLDGLAGLPSSWVDEAFGGLIRKHCMNKKRFDKLFKFVGSEFDIAVTLGLIKLNVDSALKEVASLDKRVENLVTSLAEQQAIPDDSYKPELQAILEAIRACGGGC